MKVWDVVFSGNAGLVYAPPVTSSAINDPLTGLRVRLGRSRIAARVLKCSLKQLPVPSTQKLEHHFRRFEIVIVDVRCVYLAALASNISHIVP